jgi:hypothetical protein
MTLAPMTIPLFGGGMELATHLTRERRTGAFPNFGMSNAKAHERVEKQLMMQLRSMRLTWAHISEANVLHVQKAQRCKTHFACPL